MAVCVWLMSETLQISSQTEVFAKQDINNRTLYQALHPFCITQALILMQKRNIAFALANTLLFYTFTLGKTK